ncbi:MAG: hypothetical protein ACREKM_10860 [Longimicrobiales bacterium]
MQVMPIDLTSVIAVTLGCLMVLIPVAGLTARFALKPITESIARMRESGTTNEVVALLERRVALLEQELQSVGELRDDIRRLSEDVDFRRQLQSGEQR